MDVVGRHSPDIFSSAQVWSLAIDCFPIHDIAVTAMIVCDDSLCGVACAESPLSFVLRALTVSMAWASGPAAKAWDVVSVLCIQRDRPTLLNNACERGRAAIVRTLLEGGTDVSRVKPVRTLSV